MYSAVLYSEVAVMSFCLFCLPAQGQWMQITCSLSPVQILLIVCGPCKNEQ